MKMHFPERRNFLQTNKKPLIVILGPTAVGKTEYALYLAEYFNGEIVSADSRLFYRGMDIGTAKPSLQERKKVRHYLIDVADPDETWSLSVFQSEAKKAIARICASGKLPFLVGGTGQYIQAVCQGWSPPAYAPNMRLRSVLQHWGKEIGYQAMHDRLRVLDAVAADVIDPPNIRRTIRAIEVILGTGNLFSKQRRKNETDYHIYQIGLNRPRSELYSRIDKRIQDMLEAGFLAEVQSLLRRGYDPNLPSMSAIGYQQIVYYLRGRMTLDEALLLMRRYTRNYVRRQANWFRIDDPQIHWFDIGKTTMDEMKEAISSFLKTVELG